MVYDTPTQYLPPTYKSSTATAAAAANPPVLTVTVVFDNVPTKLVAAADHCKTELKVPASECAWFSITGSDKVVLNATATVGTDGKSLLLSAVAKTAGITPIATSFGMNAWPINTIMSAEGLPLQPWSFPTTVDTNVTSSRRRHLLFGPDCSYYTNCCRCDTPCPTCPIGCC